MSAENNKSVSLTCLWLAFALSHLISGANRHFVLSFPASAVASCELGSRFISLSLWDILRMANMPFIDQSSWRSATGLVVAPPPTPARCLMGTRAPGSPVSSNPDCGLVACLISFISDIQNDACLSVSKCLNPTQAELLLLSTIYIKYNRSLL